VQLNREELLKTYRDMATIRRFEERVQEEFSKAAFRASFISMPDKRRGRSASAPISAPGLHRQHPSRPRPQHRQGLRPGADDAGALRKKGGLCGGKAARCTSPISTAACSAPTAIVGGGPPLVVGAALTARPWGAARSRSRSPVMAGPTRGPPSKR